MSAPLVSVVVPTYNRVRFLGEAVHSALQQSWIALEVIIVDDGSTDDSPALIAKLAESDSRIRPYRQQNSGVSAARNRALSEARGEYIAFLDSDDVWHPWKLQLQVALLQSRPEVGMVWTNMDAIRPNGVPYATNYLKRMYSAYQELPNETPFAEFTSLSQLCPGPEVAGWEQASVGVGNIYSHMYHGNLVHTPTVVLRREWANRVGPFDTTMKRGGEDFKYHLATCRQGEVAFIDVPSILYRTGIGDHITNRENSLYFAHSFLRTLQEEIRDHRDKMPLSRRELYQLMARAHDWIAYESCGTGLRLQAFSHACQAMRYRGTPGNSWRTLVKSLLPQAVTKRLSRQQTVATT